MAFSATALTSAGLPAKREWGLFEKLMELNASHSKERAGLISTLRASSGLEIIIGADKVQRCQCQLLSGMHYKKSSLKSLQMLALSCVTKLGANEKSLSGILEYWKSLGFINYTVCVCACHHVCLHACAQKGCRCVFCKWGEGMQAMRIMGKSLFSQKNPQNPP